VDIKAERPITIFLTRAEEWKEAPQHPEAIANLRQLCLRETRCGNAVCVFRSARADDNSSFKTRETTPMRRYLRDWARCWIPHDKVDRAVAWAIATVLTGQGFPHAALRFSQRRSQSNTIAGIA